MIDNKYIMSEDLSFVNPGITINVWGPTIKEKIITHLLSNGHVIGFKEKSDAVLEVVAYCTICQNGVAEVMDGYYIGSIMETKCKKA